MTKKRQDDWDDGENSGYDECDGYEDSMTCGFDDEAISEEVILCEDGIFSRAERDIIDSAERCAACGYALLGGDDVMEIYATGDMIHRDCWCDYAEEAIADFGKLFEYSGSGERE